MGKFRVGFGVGDIAPGGHIDIMQGEGGGAIPHRNGQMAGILPGAKIAPLQRCDGQTREDGDAIIALDAANGAVAIARFFKGGMGEMVVGAFGFLQAQHIGRLCMQETQHLIEPQAHRIDIPGCQLHALLSRWRGGKTSPIARDCGFSPSAGGGPGVRAARQNAAWGNDPAGTRQSGGAGHGQPTGRARAGNLGGRPADRRRAGDGPRTVLFRINPDGSIRRARDLWLKQDRHRMGRGVSVYGRCEGP